MLYFVSSIAVRIISDMINGNNCNSDVRVNGNGNMLHT